MGSQTSNRWDPAPPAHVIVTNNPHVFTQYATFRRWAIGEGFKIPDAKVDSQFTSLREVVKARAKHIEMVSLIKSLAEHDHIPITFDGEIPELAFGEHCPRLKIGERYS